MQQMTLDGRHTHLCHSTTCMLARRGETELEQDPVGTFGSFSIHTTQGALDTVAWLINSLQTDDAYDVDAILGDVP